MTKDFNYHLTGTGWAEAFFSSDTQNIRFEISYLSDPLADLFEGLCRLISNQSDTEKVIFAEEPGEHCLIISRQDNDIIKVEIYWSDEWEEISIAYKTTSKKELVYSDSDTLKNFTAVICTGIDSLLERLTLTEYKEKWHLFEFPTDSYKKLRQLLN
jgi:hypothetical protein